MFLALIGYRGTGKTTVARLVALELGWDWVDADVEVELRAGKSIAAIFADDGEGAFRDLESAVLEDLVRRDRTVLALGGGVILREENREQLNKAAGKVVWLQAPAAVLYQRIEADAATKTQRPNLTAGGGLAEVEKLLALREPFYRECSHRAISTETKSPGEVAAEIVAWLRASSPCVMRSAECGVPNSAPTPHSELRTPNSPETPDNI